MNVFTVLILACLGQVRGQSFDAKAFVQLMESQSMNGQEFYLEYEGRIIITSDSDKKSLMIGEDGIFKKYSGSFRTKGADAAIVDMFLRRYPENDLVRHTLASLSGKQESRKLNDSTGKWTGELKNAYPQEFDNNGSYGRIYLLGQLKNLLRGSPELFTYEEQQTIQGKKCEVVSFDLGSEKNSVTKRFWIDLEHGCHPIQSNLYVDKSLAVRAVVNLKEFKDTKDRTVWLPVSGRSEAFNDTSSVDANRFLINPTSLEDIGVVESTIRFSDPSPDDNYKIKFAKGTFINDRIRQDQYEFGQQGQKQAPPESRADAEKRLNQMLAEARQDKTILEASSEPHNWSQYQSYLLIFFVALGSIGFVVLIVRRIKGRPS